MWIQQSDENSLLTVTLLRRTFCIHWKTTELTKLRDSNQPPCSAMIEFHAINPFHSSKCRTYFDVPTYWFNSFHFLVTKGIENTFWQESAWYSKAPILVYRKRHDQGQCLLSSFIHWDAGIELPETRHTWRLYGFEHRRITSSNLILWRIGRMSVKWVRIC